MRSLLAEIRHGFRGVGVEFIALIGAILLAVAAAAIALAVV
ncbi:MAG: hypothetical protein WEA76_10180 [Acidimicrobiia bacterium]